MVILIFISNLFRRYFSKIRRTVNQKYLYDIKKYSTNSRLFRTILSVAWKVYIVLVTERSIKCFFTNCDHSVLMHIKNYLLVTILSLWVIVTLTVIIMNKKILSLQFVRISYKNKFGNNRVNISGDHISC